MFQRRSEESVQNISFYVGDSLQFLSNLDVQVDLSAIHSLNEDIKDFVKLCDPLFVYKAT